MWVLRTGLPSCVGGLVAIFVGVVGDLVAIVRLEGCIYGSRCFRVGLRVGSRG